MGATVRVLLTLPPDIHRLEIYRVLGMKAPPLGLAWIAAVLERAGHRVKIIDTATLEMDSDTWIREVKLWKPDVVGISMLTPTAPKAYRAVRMLKDYDPDLPVIAGGPHPTYMYEEALRQGFDIVVRGEGEYTMLELVEVLERYGMSEEALRRVKGLAFRGREGIVVTEDRPPIHDLDELPWPARHLLPMDKYTLFNKNIRVAHVMASRGCPYGCMYCITSYFWGRRARFRSARNVADEIEHLVYKYRAEYIVFSDDELTLNRKFVRELINELRARGLDIPFACGARADHLDREFMGFLERGGCKAIYVGVESASQETLDKIGKRLKLDRVVKVFEWRKGFDMLFTASFILGFPWETLEDMKKTVNFAIKLDPDYAQFTVLTPYPGTPLYDYVKRYGLIEDRNWENYTTLRPVMRGFRFTRGELARMLKYAYRKFYLRPAFVLRELRKGRLKDLIGILFSELMSMIKEVVVHYIRWR